MSATRTTEKSIFRALVTAETTVNRGPIREKILKFFEDKKKPKPLPYNGLSQTNTKTPFSRIR
jgi:hypothetical protein